MGKDKRAKGTPHRAVPIQVLQRKLAPATPASGSTPSSKPESSKKSSSSSSKPKNKSGHANHALDFDSAPESAQESPKKSSKKGRSLAHQHPSQDPQDSAAAADAKPSEDDPAAVFAWMIHPIPTEEFYATYFEKRPLLIQRRDPTYYQGVYTKADIEALLSAGDRTAGVDADVTLYRDRVRSTMDKGQRLDPADVWDKFEAGGCSVRVLHPQRHSEKVWHLCEQLEEFAGVVVGANAYLTPRGSQGFAPHYDDVEVFVLQTEGKKHWRVYEPLDEATTLPRYSSKDLDEAALPKPILDVVLEAGDMLYFPRGFLHQAKTIPDAAHSLHLTVSTNQKTTWYDFLAEALPRALEVATPETLALRRALPRNYFSYMGVAHSGRVLTEREASLREEFHDQAVKLAVEAVKSHMCTDAAADHMCVDFFRNALPPMLSKKEKARLVGGAKAVAPAITSKIRLVRANIARIVPGEDGSEEIVVAHTLANNRDIEQNPDEPGALAFPVEDAIAIETVLAAFPGWVDVAKLPAASDEIRVDIATALFNEGLVMCRETDSGFTPLKSDRKRDFLAAE